MLLSLPLGRRTLWRYYCFVPDSLVGVITFTPFVEVEGTFRNRKQYDNHDREKFHPNFDGPHVSSLHMHGGVPTPRTGVRQNTLSQQPPWAAIDKVIVPRDEGLPEAALILLFIISSPLPLPSPPLVAFVMDSLPQRPGPTRHFRAIITPRHCRLPSPPPSLAIAMKRNREVKQADIFSSATTMTILATMAPYSH